MKRTNRFLLLCALAMAACGGGDDAADTANSAATATTQQPGQQADKDLGDVTEYRLTMEGMDKFFQAQRNLGLAASELTREEREAMEAENDASDNNESLDAMVKRIESNKMANDAIRKAGLTAREYTLLTVATMQAAMAASVLQMRPNDNQDSLAREMKVNPANIKFMKDNQAEFQRRQDALQAEMHRLGLDNADEEDGGQ